MSCETFLRQFWEYWLVVGVASRRVRKQAGTEKATVVLTHLWDREPVIPTEPFDANLPAGFQPAARVLWLRRKGIRDFLDLPRAQFPDDDAVNVFYAGQAIYKNLTNFATSGLAQEWRTRRVIDVTRMLPDDLLRYARVIGIDPSTIRYDGTFLAAYDDATIVLGATRDTAVLDVLAYAKDHDEFFDPAARAAFLLRDKSLPVPPQVDRRQARLLVVDNDLAYRVLYSAIFRRQGYGVQLAENASRAIECLQHEEFDTVLLELHMPPEHGETVLDYLQEHDRTLLQRVVIITARSRLSASIYGRCSIIMGKPFDPDVLVAHVRRLTPFHQPSV